MLLKWENNFNKKNLIFEKNTEYFLKVYHDFFSSVINGGGKSTVLFADQL